ncbi:hypothetical protein [Ammoniphilus sp. 3BR4]|uniref:hypothetical protein n=1 Tax=Ammoniphilus sp. 3BR4 TaxID=3158265 RepID=UPI0034657A14
MIISGSHNPHFRQSLEWCTVLQRLHKALDEEKPLLELLNDLAAITSSFDEWLFSHVPYRDKRYDRLLNSMGCCFPKEPLLNHCRIENKIKKLTRSLSVILSALEPKNIQFLSMDQINLEQETFLYQYYFNHIFPLLTPMAVDVSHPFPVLSNKNYLNLVVLLKNNKLEKNNPLFAIVGVPCVVPRLLKLPSVENEL